VPAASLTNLTTLSFKSTNGSTASVEIKRGSLEHAGSQQIGGDSLGSSCPVNDQTDAVIPFSYTVTNTTSSFSIATDFAGLFVKGVALTNLTLQAEDVVGTHTQCTDVTSGWLDVYDASLPPGQSATTDGFFIIGSYYSPSNPGGDIADMNGVTLTLLNYGDGVWSWDQSQPSSGLGTPDINSTDEPLPRMPYIPAAA